MVITGRESGGRPRGKFLCTRYRVHEKKGVGVFKKGNRVWVGWLSGVTGDPSWGLGRIEKSGTDHPKQGGTPPKRKTATPQPPAADLKGTR